MPFFTYTDDLPNPANDPSVDAPDMQVNTNSGSDIWDVDHVGFNAALGGTHKFTTYSSKNTPAAQSGQSSAAYTFTGIDNPAVPQYGWTNSQGVFPLSAIKAFCNFSRVGAGLPSPTLNKFNVVSVDNTGVAASGPYTITLEPNTISSSNVLVFISHKGSNASTDYTVNFPAQTIVLDTIPAVSITNVLIIQI